MAAWACPAWAPHRTPSFNIFLPEHAFVGRGRSVVLSGRPLPRAKAGAALEKPRLEDRSAGSRAPGSFRRFPFRAIHLLPRLCARFFSALGGFGRPERNSDAEEL